MKLRLLGVAACLAVLAAPSARAADPTGPDEVPIEVTVLQTSDQPGESDPRCERFEKILRGTVAYGSLAVLDVHKRSVPVNEVWTVDLPTQRTLQLRPLEAGPRQDLRPARRRVARVQHHEAGIVDPAVGIFEPLDEDGLQRRPGRIGAEVERPRGGEDLPPPEMVVDEEPEPQQPRRPEPCMGRAAFSGGGAGPARHSAGR